MIIKGEKLSNRTCNFKNIKEERKGNLLNFICKKDILSDYFIILKDRQINITNYMSFQKPFYQLRGSIVEWLFSIITKINATPGVLFKALQLLDLFLSKETRRICEMEEIQLIGAVCYFIAHKLLEVNSVDIHFIQKYLLKEKFSLEAIFKTEVAILKRINFNLQNSTLSDFSEFLFEQTKKTIINNCTLNEKNKICELTKFFEILQKIIYFVNLMSLLVEDLIFDYEPLKIFLINFKTSLLIFGNFCKEDENIIELLQNLNACLSTIIPLDLREELDKISQTLYVAILEQLIQNKKHIFTIYCEVQKKISYLYEENNDNRPFDE
jgi:hypothetical protein